MKKKDSVHIAVILDRTGSMEVIRDDTIGGFNTFLKDSQRDLKGATFTLAQFDSENAYEVLADCVNIADVKPLTRETYVPRACTPLLDAIGRGINDLEVKAKDATKVVMAIITDGQENASREFRLDKIKEMIKEKQDKNKWQFVFLSADLASVNDALSYGIAAASSMAYDPNSQGTQDAYYSLTSSVRAYATSQTRGNLAFTQKDRDQQKNEKKRKT